MYAFHRVFPFTSIVRWDVELASQTANLPVIG